VEFSRPGSARPSSTPSVLGIGVARARFRRSRGRRRISAYLYVPHGRGGVIDGATLHGLAPRAHLPSAERIGLAVHVHVRRHGRARADEHEARRSVKKFLHPCTTCTCSMKRQSRKQEKRANAFFNSPECQFSSFLIVQDSVSLVPLYGARVRSGGIKEKGARCVRRAPRRPPQRTPRIDQLCFCRPWDSQTPRAYS